MNHFFFNRILIIGIGLIGGSMAKALRKNNLAKEIWAYDNNIESINLAKKNHIIDGFFVIDHEIKKFDLIIIATPLDSYLKLFSELNQFLTPDNLVIDLGSIKNFKSDLLKKIPNLIGCHPISGSHNTDFVNSHEDLFVNKKFIICQYPNSLNNNKVFLEKIITMAREIKAQPELLDAKLHDKIYALTSHLPQFLSFLTREFSPKKIDDDFLKTCFRLDNSSPEIWQEIFKLNQQNLEYFYQIFYQNLLEDFDQLDNINFQQHRLIINDFNFKLLTNNENNWLNNNFTEIFFRYLIVVNYLKIDQLKSYLNYTGQGFCDFTKITSIISIDPEKLNQMLKVNLPKIKKIFDKFLN
jgi:prephenate dehydrogenase